MRSMSLFSESLRVRRTIMLFTVEDSNAAQSGCIVIFGVQVGY